ncbi:DUF1622 domain-containing protein [Sulfurivermis fontis]|uniref:DUF1622 domain-containing protein n=1 Tax=Sulfurivermis fontis TaxID=1972068 RepID=UPI000FDAEB55|nr:DUF1622 domain-containing protein [Sulfurivermis fontis]
MTEPHTAQAWLPGPHPGALEASIINGVEWLRLIVETTGALIIALGIVFAVQGFVRALHSSREADFTAVRLTFARYLSLALEFQLGADILSTAIAPSWDQIGKLGAIAVIRTALNFFLQHEMRAEQHELYLPGNDTPANNKLE